MAAVRNLSPQHWLQTHIFKLHYTLTRNILLPSQIHTNNKPINEIMNRGNNNTENNEHSSLYPEHPQTDCLVWVQYFAIPCSLSAAVVQSFVGWIGRCQIEILCSISSSVSLSEMTLSLWLSLQTSFTMTWAVYTLALKKEVQQEIYEEVLGVLGSEETTHCWPSFPPPPCPRPR